MIIRTDIDRKHVRVFSKSRVVIEFYHNDFTKEFIEHVGTILDCETKRIESVKNRVLLPRRHMTIRNNNKRIVLVRNGRSSNLMMNGYRFSVSYCKDLHFRGYESIVFAVGNRLALYLKIGKKYASEDQANHILNFFNVSIKENKVGW